MKKLHIGVKIGLIMEFIAGLLMAVLILCSKPVPDLVAWIFCIGLVMALTSLFIKKSSKRM